MPKLDWIGKDAVVRHHLETPYRLVHCNGRLSAGVADSGNLLVQGDNLEALRALLPYYAGKVKCIYIDPPFGVGANFSMNVEIGGETLTKKPNVLEQIAYCDTWGKREKHVAIKPHIKKIKGGRIVSVELTKFSTHYSQDSEESKPNKVIVREGQVYRTVKDGEPELLTKKWSDWVVDFDYESRSAAVRVQNEDGDWEERLTGEYIFENEWQSFRTRKARVLELQSMEKEISAKPVKIAVKVVDIFGNNTMKVLEV